MFLNRTPLNFRDIDHNITNDESLLESTANLNPSVEFVEITNPSTFLHEYNEMESFESALSSICEELTQSFHETSTTEIKPESSPPKYLETNFDEPDPRSPSADIERTPLVLKEIITDDKTEQLEEEEKSKEEVDDEINDMVNEVISDMKKLTKPLSLLKPKEKFGKASATTTQTIFEDVENVKYSTPKKTTTANETAVRTPLGCVANRPHFRSKSSESAQKVKNVFGAHIKGNSYDEAKVKVINRLDENTPKQFEEMHSNSKGVLLKSKSRIPVVSNRHSNN